MYALLSECAFKLPTAMCLFAVECGGPCVATRQLVSYTRRRPAAWTHISVPALLYTVGAVLQVVGATNLDAPVVKLVFQAKIPMTAACAVCGAGSVTNTLINTGATSCTTGLGGSRLDLRAAAALR